MRAREKWGLAFKGKVLVVVDCKHTGCDELCVISVPAESVYCGLIAAGQILGCVRSRPKQRTDEYGFDVIVVIGNCGIGDGISWNGVRYKVASFCQKLENMLLTIGSLAHTLLGRQGVGNS